MVAKLGEARRRAFLRALEQSGNQTLSAEKAKVSRSWVGQQRSRDAGFDAACREAVAAAKGRFDKLSVSAEGSRRPPSGWGFLDGAELVVSGTNGRRTQVRRARVKQWTARVEQRFLAALASTCNVKAACAEVGMSFTSAYAHRHRWPAFERAWDAAVETGYARLESELVLAARNLFADQEPAVPSAITGMTVAQAVHLLHMHKHHVHGVGKGPHVALRSPLPEATARLEKVMRGLGLIPRDGGNQREISSG